jgi:ubiquinone/menaquinone biosynthesis C-methylase UbiE
MSEESQTRPRRRAFAVDAAGQTARSALKALWWTGAGMLARRIARPESARPADFKRTAGAAPSGFVRRAWLATFEKDARDVAAGLYPARDDARQGLGAAFTRTADFLADARQVEARRRRGGGVEAREDAPASAAYPTYYRQNFHFQTGGWFTDESARRYDAQVEALFAGSAGAMRRRALSLLARHWKGQDHRGRIILDVACGSGSFLADLEATFPRARIFGLDLSPAYLQEARRRSPRTGLLQANAERLPFADASLDAVVSIYLFHELPPKVRTLIAAELARVLKPGGVLAFADSVQPADDPRLERLLEAFPAYFHEPYYSSYAALDLPALFANHGLHEVGVDSAFLTKALLFERR